LPLRQRITYNVLGQKTDMIDPDMGKWKYGYDLGGNLITQTDALTHSLIFQYDRLNRVTSKWYSDTSGKLLVSLAERRGARLISKQKAPSLSRDRAFLFS
jgi:YD repeat-containing protein